MALNTACGSTCPPCLWAWETEASAPKIPLKPITIANTTMVASNSVVLDSESDARKVLRVIDLLEELDDVQNVYANFDIPDAILDLVEA